MNKNVQLHNFRERFKRGGVNKVATEKERNSSDANPMAEFSSESESCDVAN